MSLFKSNLKLLAKKIFYLNFVTKFFGRICFQPLYKTFRLIKSPKRFRASLWVDWHKEVVDVWMLKKNEKIYLDYNYYYKQYQKIIFNEKNIEQSQVKQSIARQNLRQTPRYNRGLY